MQQVALIVLCSIQQDLAQVYKHEILELVGLDNGTHFDATSVSTEQLEGFSVDGHGMD